MSPKDDDAGMPLVNTSSRREGRKEGGREKEAEEKWKRGGGQTVRVS